MSVDEAAVAAIAQLIVAIAQLLWPISLIFAIWLFRADVRGLLTRLKKGSLFGQEVELETTIAALEGSAAALPSVAMPIESRDRASATSDSVKRILEQAASSPKAALMLLSAELDRKSRELLASRGHWKEGGGRPVVISLRELQGTTELSPDLSSAIDKFQSVRNRIVHGRESTPDDMLRAIDAGVMIMRAIDAVPRELHMVYHPGVPLYADATCTQLREGVRGVVLETIGPGAQAGNHRIYPTTRTDYKKGKAVAWEWSFDRKWDRTWYRDPDSNEIKHAWSSSAEFVGRHLDDL